MSGDVVDIPILKKYRLSTVNQPADPMRHLATDGLGHRGKLYAHSRCEIDQVVTALVNVSQKPLLDGE